MLKIDFTEVSDSLSSMTFTPQELASRIRDARTARGLTLKELADRAGIGKTAMFDLEHGNPGVRLNTLLAVLQILDIELSLPPNSDTPAASSAPPPTPADSLPDHLL
ncbi:MAG: helix-turn-helix domain-containing protein [Kiritimatiellia bacterium]